MDEAPRNPMVELWFDAPVQLDLAALAAALRERDETVQLQGEADAPIIFHPRFTHTYADGKVACITHPLFSAAGGLSQEIDFSQSWFFPDAAATAARVQATMLVGQMMAAANPLEQRIEAFTTVLTAVLAVTDPIAVWSPNTQQLVQPEYVRQQPLEALINVRMFNISNDPGVQVMDTLGLHVFGLPDVQCHFRDIDPNRLGPLLFNTAAYLTERGDIIEDGQTIPGVEGTEFWHCQHEESLVDPKREVLDVDPGEPFAAGRRERAW